MFGGESEKRNKFRRMKIRVMNLLPQKLLRISIRTLKLTNNFVVVVVLDSHLDFLDAKIHFDVFNAEESSVVVVLLVRDSFEVNFAFHSVVFAPIVSGAGSFYQKPETVSCIS